MSSVQYLIGKSLGKYDILEHVGHGGMSEVYKGQQAQLNRMVAVKVLHPFLADEEGFVVRFQREARIVATLRHPNIVQVYDFDYHEDLAIYYMVMEYIDGPTLKTLLERAPLSADDTIRVGIAIAEALHYAHQRNMVHRDIKPANIMFLDNKEPVLADFGIARMLALSGLTVSGAMVGTPAYMAPEIGTGSTGAAASDIYSLGIVLYQAVTGNLPFMAETPMGMVMDHINKPPPRPSIFAPDIPKDLEQVILRSLEKSPEARFQTAEEMAATLRRLLNPEWHPTPTTSLSPSSKQAALPKEITPLINSVPEDRSASEEAGKAIAPSDFEDRLIKSWPPVQTSVPITPAAGEELPIEEGSLENLPMTEVSPSRRLRQAAQTSAAWFLLLLVGILLGSGIWMGFDGSLTSFAQGLRAVNSVGAVTSGNAVTNTETPTVTLTAAIAAAPTTTTPPMPTPTTPTPTTPTPHPSPTPVPSVTPTPQCAFRIRLDHVNIEPNRRVAPESSLMAYLTLRNSGTCAWPADSELRLAGESLLDVPDRIEMGALEPGHLVNVLFPFTAPEELGVHTAELELRDAGSVRLGNPFKVEITVEDIPLVTSTPVPALTLQIETPQPLAVSPSSLLRWEDQPDRDRWTGMVQLTAEGGSGTYRYYQETVSASTEIVEGRLTVVGKRCEPVILYLWVLSGDQTLRWEETISYPAAEKCQ